MKKIKIHVGSMVNQCPTCGAVFNSLGAFDKHRTGEYGKPIKNGYSPSMRTCKTPDQMLGDGMVLNSQKRWISAPMPEGMYTK